MTHTRIKCASLLLAKAQERIVIGFTDEVSGGPPIPLMRSAGANRTGNWVRFFPNLVPITTNGAQAIQWSYQGADQQWSLETIDGRCFWFKNRASGKALAIDNNRINQNFAPAVQWDYHGHNQNGHQQWFMEKIDDRHFWLKNRASGKALSIDNNRIAENGALVVQWDYHGNQQNGHQQCPGEKSEGQ
jgi:hypothetical protein